MKKPKTYNLNRSVYEAVNKRALADGRKDSDWLNRFLTDELVEVKIKPVKTVLAQPKFNFKNELLALGVDKKVLSDWLVVRKDKKASNTETALTAILNQIKLTDLSVADAIHYSCKEGWAGFKASWYQNKLSKPVQQSITEQLDDTSWVNGLDDVL